MFNIDEIFSKYNMDNEKYEQLLKDCSDKINGLSELDWSEISEKYNLGFAGDTLRKAQQVPLIGGSFIKEYYTKKLDNNSSSTEYQEEINSQIRELERQRIKYRDERNAWNKQNYSDARVEQKLDYLEKELSKLGKINFENTKTITRNNKNEMIICLSDLHIGQSFSSISGEYNSDIANERLAKYLDVIRENAELYNVSNAKVIVLGDLISGNIHSSIQVTNRENVIEQIKIASEIISSFCYRCSEIFTNVEMYNVSGNHSRIQKKDDAIHDERLDDLIGWIVGHILSSVDNFKYINNNLDTGIATFDVLGKKYIAVHGDYDPMNKTGVTNLSFMLGYIPYAMFRGHMHYPSFQDIGGIKVIQSGSLAGAGDQHTLEMRLIGKPSQTICICDNSGIKVHIPVEL